MNRPFILAAVGAVAIVIAIVLSFVFDRDGGQPTKPKEPPQVTAEKQAPVSNRPSFDIVRINPKGDAVIAGRARPGSEVEVRDGDKTIGKITADARGEWVLVPEQPLTPGAHSLNLIARLNGETSTSESDVILVVPETGRDIAGRDAGSEGGALALGTGPNGSTRLLQTPGTRAPKGKLAVEIIDFDENGRTTVSGQSPPSADVRLFIDGQNGGNGRADANGEWQVTLSKPLLPGTHTLKVDQMNGSRVADSVEVTFARPVSGPESSGSVVVVEPGNSLWRIARRTYGQGTRYTLIFEANRDRISHPDLIYPGQVFNLPARQDER